MYRFFMVRGLGGLCKTGPYWPYNENEFIIVNTAFLLWVIYWSSIISYLENSLDLIFRCCIFTMYILQHRILIITQNINYYYHTIFFFLKNLINSYQKIFWQQGNLIKINNLNIFFIINGEVSMVSDSNKLDCILI